MLVCISPAKKLNWAPVERMDLTQPDFEKDALNLVKVARKLSVQDLEKLMSISTSLAQLNKNRFHEYDASPKDDAQRPAAFAFAGDTFQGLEASSLSDDDMRWAQDHLRILSGLYGILRPLDNIQAYRLEMGSRLKTNRGRSLYDYWGKLISNSLNDQAEKTGSKFLVNCASQEYFGSVDLKALSVPVITPKFLEFKDGKEKMVSFYAKKARGAMARFVIQNRLIDKQQVSEFDLGGYVYQPNQSSVESPVFLRDYPD
jgi:cytoplasmic iron level regulating protein YaaA (DUF328/UPF0246 family)